ncbi:MAG: UDP-glucose--hexose-1-phosphate uridylyltransferase [Spirochaetales bacterium]|nr:UDP-glucose--hexose-1-phosphate uridylyltransferase [Spirochaetales bacterium]
MNESIFRSIDRLVTYGVVTGLLPEVERIYATNLILDLLHLDSYDGVLLHDESVEKLIQKEPEKALESLLEPLVGYALDCKIIEDMQPLKDIFDSKLMNALTPRPQSVIDSFWKDYDESPESATLNYFRFSKNTNYIRRDRIARDEKWSGMTKYGRLEILVSLSKPELDPKAIAAARVAKSTGYPKCALCRENEGYAGRIDFAPRQNHRIIPFKLCGEAFSLQFSPYRYCHQHCIVLNDRHVPMAINESALSKLLEFVTLFPHYFLGSNTDLPYVGGSVLSHEHFQGGVHRLPIMDAAADRVFFSDQELELSTLYWPISTVRVKGKNRDRVLAMASKVLKAWRNGYRDDSVTIDPGTAEDPHNTLAPLACREGDEYVLFLMLRNNKRTEERPDGLYHTHPSRFHIKKEGIGIIDAPGLAILPPRLKGELAVVKEILLGKAKLADHPEVEKHSSWMEEIRSRHDSFDPDTIDSVLKNEVVQVFMQMLEDCGVFKQTEEGRAAFERFMKRVLES